MKLSAAIATYNEELNISACLESIKDIVDEIVIVDGGSNDRTVEFVKKFGAKVVITDNPPIFHINKQKSFDSAKGEWILYLDADERVSPELAKEIKHIVDMDETQIEKYQTGLKNKELFNRHQRILEQRDGKIGENEGDYVAFFVPRLNYFLGKYLRFGGVYPDGVIRLFKKDKAFLPCKSVHEQMIVLGRVGWLKNDLIHIDSPTFERYLQRNSRYVDLIVDELKKDNISKNIVYGLLYFFIKPVYWFLLVLFLHKGILDGIQGIIFAFFSALRFPRAYFRYLNT